MDIKQTRQLKDTGNQNSEIHQRSNIFHCIFQEITYCTLVKMIFFQ